MTMFPTSVEKIEHDTAAFLIFMYQNSPDLGTVQFKTKLEFYRPKNGLVPGALTHERRSRVVG